MSQSGALPALFGNPVLEGLSEVILPVPVGLLPLAPGWAYVGVLLLLLMALAVYRGFRRWWRNRYRRAALAELDCIASKQQLPVARLHALAVLVKATALQIYPREDIAVLTGVDWIDYLNSRAGYVAFSEQAGLLLGQSLYDARSETLSREALDNLIHQIHRWLRRHPLPAVTVEGGSR